MEQVAGVDCILSLLGQLLKNFELFWLVNALVEIILPAPLEMRPNAIDKVLSRRVLLVEVGQETEELRELIAFVDPFHQVCVLIEYVQKVTHYNREEGSADEENDDADDAFGVGLRVQVTETDG